MKLATTLLSCALLMPTAAWAQKAPTDNDIFNYRKLQAAAYRNDPDRISGFVAEGDDLESRDENGRTPIIIGAFQKSYDTISSLVDAGADINAADNDGFTAYTIGLSRSDTVLTNLAIKLGNNIDQPSGEFGNTVLGNAARSSNVELVEALISSGADLDFVNSEGDSALHQVIKYGDGGTEAQKIVQLLLEAGARPGMKDADGLRPRQRAKALGYDEIVQIYKDFNNN